MGKGGLDSYWLNRKGSESSKQNDLSNCLVPFLVVFIINFCKGKYDNFIICGLSTKLIILFTLFSNLNVECVYHFKTLGFISRNNADGFSPSSEKREHLLIMTSPITKVSCFEGALAVKADKLSSVVSGCQWR